MVGLRKRKSDVYWHSKTHKTMFYMRTLEGLRQCKHLVIRWDVTATRDIHVHFFGVTLTVTANSQEQQTEVRISTTDVHWLTRVIAASIIPNLSCLNVLQLLSWR